MFSDSININISLPKIKGPPKLGYPSYVHEMKILNPSIVLAPNKNTIICLVQRNRNHTL